MMFGGLQSVFGGNPVLIALLLLPVVFQLSVSVVYIIMEAIQRKRGVF